MKKYKYKVVRSYEDGKCEETKLQKYFDEGYQFVRASEYVPPFQTEMGRRFGYIEYILVKEESNVDTANQKEMV